MHTPQREEYFMLIALAVRCDPFLPPSPLPPSPLQGAQGRTIFLLRLRYNFATNHLNIPVCTRTASHSRETNSQQTPLLHLLSHAASPHREGQLLLQDNTINLFSSFPLNRHACCSAIDSSHVFPGCIEVNKKGARSGPLHTTFVSAQGEKVTRSKATS